MSRSTAGSNEGTKEIDLKEKKWSDKKSAHDTNVFHEQPGRVAKRPASVLDEGLVAEISQLWVCVFFIIQ